MSTDSEPLELEPTLVAALNNRRRSGEAKEDVIKRLLKETYNAVAIDEFLRGLQTYGAEFIAASEDDLANGRLWLTATIPPEEQDQLSKYIADTHAVTIAGTDFPINLTVGTITNGDLHFHRRIPVAAPDHLDGVDAVDLEEGIENLRSFVRDDRDPTPHGTGTIPLGNLAADLADAGAAAVTIAHEHCLLNDEIRLVGYLPAGTGYDICGPYNAVTIDDEEYPLTCRFKRAGLNTHYEEPVYIDDSWIRVDTVTIEDGLDNVRNLLNADSYAELYS